MTTTTMRGEEEAYSSDELVEEEICESWKQMARTILSTTRIDASTKGKNFELFVQFSGDITDDHVRSLQSSEYGRRFKSYIELWRSRPSRSGWADISHGVELFTKISTVTHSCFREVQHLEKSGKQLTDLEILKNAQFLTTRYWDKSHLNFEVNALAEQLNTYISSEMEWEYIGKTLLRMCVRRAYNVEFENGRSLSDIVSEKIFGSSSMVGIFATVILRILGYLTPRLIGIAIIVGVFLWSINNLDSSKHPILASLGLLFSVVSGVGTFIRYGTKEIRDALERIVRPPHSKWNEFEPFIDADLYAIDQAINHFCTPHINLRLVREQLIRLQRSDVQIPVQFLTLVDRAISRGCHSW